MILFLISTLYRIRFSSLSAWLMYLLSVPALLWIISLVLFYFKACNYLGYNPGYNHPDPKELIFYDQYNGIIAFWMNTWVLSLFAWLIVVMVTILKLRWDISWKAVVFSSIPHLSGILILFSELPEWYFD